MTLNEIIAEIEQLGNENYKRILINHGAREPVFGVKIEDLKKLAKKIKKDYPLSLQLYNTGNFDAMYLAGLIADEGRMTPADLTNWVHQAYNKILSEYTVAWIAAESKHGYAMAQEWIDSVQELVAAAGWSTLSNWVALHPDEDLDIPALEKSMKRIRNEIHNAPDRVRYTMNGFIIALGTYVLDLTEQAILTAQTIGTVQVNMNGTACQVPDAVEYIEKVKARNKIGKKRKMARC